MTRLKVSSEQDSRWHHWFFWAIPTEFGWELRGWDTAQNYVMFRNNTHLSCVCRGNEISWMNSSTSYHSVNPMPSSTMPLPSQSSTSSFLLFTHPSSSNHPSFSFHKREETRSFIISRFILLITTLIGFISINREGGGRKMDRVLIYHLLHFFSIFFSFACPSTVIHHFLILWPSPSFPLLLLPTYLMYNHDRRAGNRKEEERREWEETTDQKERWGWVMVGELSWEWEESYWWRERSNHISSLT